MTNSTDAIEPGNQDRKQRRRRWRRIALGVFFFLMLGLWCATPTFGKLNRQLDRIDLPVGTKLTQTERSGNVICFDTCPHLSRTYSVAGETQRVELAVVSALRGAGYQVFIKETEDYRPSFAIGKRYKIDWSVYEGDLERTMVELTISQRTDA